jgi:hypothetical protein
MRVEDGVLVQQRDVGRGDRRHEEIGVIRQEGVPIRGGSLSGAASAGACMSLI